MSDDHLKCPVCGETDPGTRWLCLPRVKGEAEQGKPCGYSVEGHRRLQDAYAEKLADARAALGQSLEGEK